MAEKKEKRHVSNNAQLMSEWNWERNTDVDPVQLTLGSNKKVWWVCIKGHTWQASIKDRHRGNGCPFCSGRYPIVGENDLLTVSPTLAAEWNPYKNNGLTPTDVTHFSDKKVWWLCVKGHEWQARVSNRTIGRGCPYCSGKKVLKGYNDLQTHNPNLAKEWNYDKNGELTPADVMPSSNKKVWWRCAKGHEWEASINDRSRGTGCPTCKVERKTSFPEYAIVYYLKKHDIDTIHLYRGNGYELDIYIPSLNTAIEYDGCFWHRNKTKSDLLKNQKCREDGIILYRIREGIPSLNDTSIDYIVEEKQKNLAEILTCVLSKIIGIKIDVDLDRDYIDIENLREFSEKQNSLLVSKPELVKEWNYKKNGNITPENITANSHKKVWWICAEGHEWRATITNRHNGNGCPYCANRYVLKGYNDLQTHNPNLAKEWNYDKNGELTPADVMPSSNKKVWWRCAKGHEWEASINDRSRGTGCPYCAGKYALKGYNDLQTINPLLASEWNYGKNAELTPADVMPNSNKKVWWICAKGHEWQSTINNRSNGNGCPYCAGQRLLIGQNDLLSVNPSLAEEWNYHKNNGLMPTNVMPYSNKKVWWICSNGHEWQSTINNRSNGRGCPKCAKEKCKKNK